MGDRRQQCSRGGQLARTYTAHVSMCSLSKVNDQCICQLHAYSPLRACDIFRLLAASKTPWKYRTLVEQSITLPPCYKHGLHSPCTQQHKYIVGSHSSTAKSHRAHSLVQYCGYCFPSWLKHCKKTIQHILICCSRRDASHKRARTCATGLEPFGAGHVMRYYSTVLVILLGRLGRMIG